MGSLLKSWLLISHQMECSLRPCPTIAHGTTVLIGIRRLLRAISCRALDTAALRFARQTHPNWSASAVAERLACLYVVPARLDGVRFRAAMQRCSLHAVEEKEMLSPSFGKPKHRFIILKRSA